MADLHPIGDIFNYTEILSHYKKNKDKPWNEWLEFEKLLSPGKQGIVGLFKIKSHDIRCVFKISQYIDNAVIHEYTIMNSLNEVAYYCPHFSKSVGLVKCERNPTTEKGNNPFVKQEDTKYMIQDYALLQEYVKGGVSLYELIKRKNVDENILYSAVKQVLLAICMAQKNKNLTHYDLHSLNIIMRKCSKKMVFLYILDDGNQICVPSCGYYPIIIDYGFSYINELEDGPLWPTLEHSTSGFTSDRFDKLADPKLFLSSVSYEILNSRFTHKSKILRKLTKKMFGNLKVDLDSGWDETNLPGPVEVITKVIDKYNKTENIFYEYPNFCIDIIQSLIILPMEKQETKSLKVSLKTFFKEWNKIDNQLIDYKYKLYILKNVVEAAKYIRVEYIEGEVVDTVKVFKKMVCDAVDSVSKFCKMKDVDYDKMLCSLLILSTSMEGVMYEEMNKISTEKEEQRVGMSVTSTEHIYGMVDLNIDSDYTYDKDTIVFAIDCDRKKSITFSLTEDESSEINKAHTFYRGTLMNKIYNEKHN